MMNEAIIYLDELNDKRRKRIKRLEFIANRTRNKRIRKKIGYRLFAEEMTASLMEDITKRIRDGEFKTVKEAEKALEDGTYKSPPNVWEVSTTLEERLWKSDKEEER